MIHDWYKIPIIGIDRLRIATDGVGIRTLVAVYGCPLRCRYCLNPQSWNGHHKPKLYSVETLYNAVDVDNLYFQTTHGGITFGGGEPLIYADFIKRFIDTCPASWSFNVETSLNVATENIRTLADVIDEFIVDIKTMDEPIYQQYTGKSSSLVLRNLQYLLDYCGSERVLIRIPEIPQYTSVHDQERYHRQLQELGVTRFDLFRYSVPKK